MKRSTSAEYRIVNANDAADKPTSVWVAVALATAIFLGIHSGVFLEHDAPQMVNALLFKSHLGSALPSAPIEVDMGSAGLRNGSQCCSKNR